MDRAQARAEARRWEKANQRRKAMGMPEIPWSIWWKRIRRS